MHSVRVVFLVIALAQVTFLSGCAEMESEQAAEPSASAAAIDRSLVRAADYLLKRQDRDGAWRSDVYGNFKDGDALTPLVLEALLAVRSDERTPAACRRGADYLAALAQGGDTIDPSPHGLTYPLYASALSVIVLSQAQHSRYRGARDDWLKFLRKLQLTESLGWQASDARYGGWGYAKEPPVRPPEGAALAALAEPNLSATVFALEALRASGCPANEPSIQKARVFIEHCQNFADDPRATATRFDDGGFFFMPGDDVRNKAGVAGKDATGRTRYGSYGSTTADGLRALLLCGLPSDHLRVAAAGRWLKDHFTPDRHPGAYASDRESARPALYYYYAASVARAFPALRDADGSAANKLYASRLAKALLERQDPNGSWSNPAVQVREDDRLVATSLAIIALRACRE
jgi:squalene-hopene/tetraprenyl-beta-curcumene cyclase